jgi:hypothetical protein
LLRTDGRRTLCGVRLIQPVENHMTNANHLIAQLVPAVLAVAATVASLLSLQFALLVA